MLNPPTDEPAPEPELKNGIVEEDGVLYYYVNDVRTYAGLIMLDGDTIAFIEVKTRLSASAGEGALAVDRRKQQRITNASVLYLMKKGWQNRAVRYDVVEVRREEILYFPNAFQPFREVEMIHRVRNVFDYALTKNI